MSSKKGKKRPAKAAPPANKNPAWGQLSEQLGGRLEDKARALKERERAARLEAERLAALPPPARKLTEEELMAEAFHAASDAASDKFLGKGYNPGDIQVVRPNEPEPVPLPDPGPDGPTTADLIFFEAMADGVTPLQDKKSQLAEREWVGVSWRSEDELRALDALQLKQLELTPPQRDLLVRARKAECEVMNVRHYFLKEAMKDVESFVAGCAARGVRYLRIIHGKGRQSLDGPVLKPAVVRWSQGAGAQWVRAWAPDVDRTGDFGSVVMELWPRR